MELWPAIDLRGGKCVRLLQGDYARETVFGDDPVAMARRFVAEGARRLHLVDLDGARDGRPTQADLVARMVQAAGVPCQLGGGVRTLAAARD
ncbi:MAG: 1-(5-phosphoribosyl)-5-((5-phosphoribosylamino)methylideneamino)imidazole-4-carboxamide isomerase, partial [Planctomycetia bacterium]|nr:1-(5-phosphoribosyl)-5-((5-phosphoribosylamino)methylideneamino)imidazole-4-carboxamide isomerase [Planctomycetia bacterium]